MTARKSHRYLSGTGAGAATLAPASSDDELELDEADVWSANYDVVLPELKKQAHHHHPRPARMPLWAKIAAVDHLPRSMPVNIPDWSKILGGECRRRAADDGDDEYEGGNDRMPPHEYLASTRGASLSVHEGVGRTLKGRDLSRVRNAIWKQIGFED